MDKTASSQVHNVADYQKFVNDSMARMGQLFSEVAKLQSQAAEQATRAIDDTARLMKESITYAAQLSEEFRKLSLENSRKAAELFTPKA